MEVFAKAFGKFSSTACGRRCNTDSHNILGHFKAFFLSPFLHPFHANHLAYEFHRRLCFLCLLKRHVDVIYHEYTFCLRGNGSYDSSLTSTFKCVFDLFLSYCTFCFGGKLQEHRLNLFSLH